MTERYRVNENNLSVSHNGRVYGPGEELPDDLTEEQIENLLENDAIERSDSSDTSATPAEPATGDAVVKTTDEKKKEEEEADKAAAAAKPTATKSTASTTKPAGNK